VWRTERRQSNKLEAPLDGSARERSPAPAWAWFLIPIALCAATRDLWAPDEPRYGMIARWIYDHGEFLVLRRCGTLYPDKPPLVYWLAGLAGSLSGWSEFAMRLVSLGSVAALAWIVSRLARLWFGEAEARWAPILFLGFALIYWNGARIGLDPLLTLGCVGALYFAALPAEDAATARRHTLLAGALGGIAMLSKGPPALVNIGLPLLAWAWQRQRPTGARASKPVFAAAVALTILPVALWAVAASLREPALWKPLFFGQHLGRAVEGTAHKGPLWEHLQNVPGFLMPWSVPAIFGVVSGARAWLAFRRGEPHDAGRVRAFLWFAALFLFYSVTPTKREVYLMSAYPALALLGARELADALRNARVGRWMALVPTVFFVLLGLLFASAPLVLPRVAESSEDLAKKLADTLALVAAHAELRWGAPLIGLVFVGGALFGLREWRAGRGERWARSVAWTWGLALALVALLVYPAINEIKSDRRTALALAQQPEKPAEIPCYGTAPEGPRFYDAGACVSASHEVSLELDVRDDMASAGEQFLALFEDKDFESLPQELRDTLEIRAETKAGSRRLFVVARRRP